MQNVDDVKDKTILGGIAIFYRRSNHTIEFLVVKNKQTGNISFVSGAKEESDVSEVDTIKREILEELELNIATEKLQPTNVRRQFIFGPKKKERAGLSGSYQVFLVDGTAINSQINDTAEVEVHWMDKDKVWCELSFSDLKEVFLRATQDM